MEKKALLNDKSYCAVIFTSIQSEVNKDYEEMTELIISLAKKQRGSLWIESARSNGIGITVLIGRPRNLSGIGRIMKNTW